MAFLHETLVANGTTSLGRVVFSKAVLDMLTNDHVTDVAVNAGGTGYVVGETFDIVGGTAVGGFIARGVVAAESAGVVTAVKIISAGAYSALPGATGASTANASAAGNDDLTVDLTTQTAQWTEDRSTYVDAATDFEWLCTSVKASGAPTIGMVTVTSAGSDAVRLITASGFNGASAFDGQPDVSPNNFYLNVPGQNPELFLSSTERRANVASRDGNNVQYGGLGLFIPLTNNDASYPFPGICHAQSLAVRAMSDQYNDDGNGAANAGMLHPARYVSTLSPYAYRDNLSAEWLRVAQVASSAGAEAMIWPHKQGDADYSFDHAPELSGFNADPFASTGNENGLFQDNNGSGDTGWFEDPDGLATSTGGIQGVAPFGAGGQMSFVVTAHIIASRSGATSVIGYIDGYEAVHGVGLTAFEEIESFQSASRYIVFPDTNGSDIAQWVAMEII